MPGFIAHIVYGQKILKHNNISNPIYLIGNLYPDIRYLGVIDRDTTHINLDDDAWNKVSALVSSESVDLDLFRKGFLFHNFLDIWWNNQFPLANTDRWLGMALKLKEDQQLYPLIEDLDQLKKDLEQSAQKYHLKGVSDEDLQRWVEILSENLVNQPTLESQLNQLKRYALSAEDIQAVGEAFKRIPTDFESESRATLTRTEGVNLPEILRT